MYSTHTHLIYNYTFDFVWGKSIDAETVWNALFHFDSSDVNHNIIITSRLPRVVAALLVGAFLAISEHLCRDDKKLSCIPLLWCDGWRCLCYYT